MNFQRILIAFSLTPFLAACGGEYGVATTVEAASATVIAAAQAPAAVPETAPGAERAIAAAAAVVPAIASATMPAPDCAAEGCVSLRIIDGNAEAWRIDAQRRAALEARLSQS
jgi:hypothetical protein